MNYIRSLELYKDWYYKELERKDSIDNALNIPFGLVSALLAVCFYLLTNYDYSLQGIFRAAFILLVSGSIITIGIAIYFLLQSYHDFHKGYPYKFLPHATVIDKYYNDLIQYCKDNGKPLQEADVDFENYLTDIFREAVANDSFQNHRKTASLHWGKRFLFYSVVGLVLTSFFFGYNYYKKDKNEVIHKVEIVNQK